MSIPSMPLFCDAYFGDTKHLTCEEHGAYLQLLMIAWRSKECGIQDDDALIARMISLSLKRWRSIKATVMGFWSLGPDGLWRQKRLVDERRWVESRLEKRREAGKLGNKAKSLKYKKQAPANGSPNGHAPNPNPIPIDTERESSASLSGAREARPPPKPKPPAKHPIPSDFELTDERLRFAIDKGHDHASARDQFDQFRDSASMHDRRYCDWDKAWQTWVRNSLGRFAPTGRVAANGYRSQDDGWLGACERAASRYAHS